MAGDRITLLKRVNDEWLMGSLKGREGIFPTVFVNIVRDIDDGKSVLHTKVVPEVDFALMLLVAWQEE